VEKNSVFFLARSSSKPAGRARPASVTPGKLVSIDWSIAGGQTYDLWIDDIQFLACK